MRAHPETMVPSPSWRPAAAAPDGRTVLLIAVDVLDVSLFGGGTFTRVLARTTEEALRALERDRPHLVAIDLDLAEVDGLALCRGASEDGRASVLVTTETPERVPAALRAGCHGVLLKPYAPSLLATRLGRLLRDRAHGPALRPPLPDTVRGTNRVWPDTRCPVCAAPNATSFDFASYRRMWYACLACEAVWLGKRQE